jgi:hypothetical protein
MPFTVAASVTIQGLGCRRITGTGNLTDLQTALTALAPITAVWDRNTLTIGNGGTGLSITMEGTLVEQRVGTWNVGIGAGVHFNWGNSTAPSTTTTNGAITANATSFVVAASTNIIVGSHISFAGVTTGGEANTKYYRVVTVAGTTITVKSPIVSGVSSGATITINGSSTLGLVTANGSIFSSVNVTYNAAALTTYAGATDPVATNVAEFCIVGSGVINHQAGSLTFNQAGRSDFDFYNTGFYDLDRVTYSAANTAATYYHTLYGRSRTTSSTSLLQGTGASGASIFEAGGTTANLDITSFYTNIGVGYTSNPAPGQPANTATTLTQPLGLTFGWLTTINNGGYRTRIYDPAFLYLAPTGVWSSAVPVFEIFRSFAITWNTPTGTAVATAGVPAKLIVKGGSTNVTNGTQNYTSTPLNQPFTTAITSTYLRQSQKAGGAAYTFDGVQTQTGYTDDAVYDLWLVSYGYATKFTSQSAKPTITNVTINGFKYSTATPQNELAAAVAYASVVTTPFSMSMGTGALTLTANCTFDQVGQFLLKHTYDNPTDAYYLGLNHTVAVVSGTLLTIPTSITINSSATLSVGTIIKTLSAGVITLSSGATISNLSFSKTNIACSSPAIASGISGTTFTRNGGTYAMTITGAAADISLSGNKLYGYAATNGSTGTEAIYVNIATGTMTISIVGGGTVPSIRTAGATVNIVEISNLIVTNVVGGSSIRVNRTSDGVVLVNTIIVGTSQVFALAYTGEVQVVLRKASSPPYYQEYIAVVTVGSGNTVTAAQQRDDL